MPVWVRTTPETTSNHRASIRVPISATSRQKSRARRLARRRRISCRQSWQPRSGSDEHRPRFQYAFASQFAGGVILSPRGGISRCQSWQAPFRQRRTKAALPIRVPIPMTSRPITIRGLGRLASREGPIRRQCGHAPLRRQRIIAALPDAGANHRSQAASCFRRTRGSYRVASVGTHRSGGNEYSPRSDAGANHRSRAALCFRRTRGSYSSAVWPRLPSGGSDK